MDDELTLYIEELQRQEVSPKTVKSYRSDLTGFGRWFAETNGEPFSAAATTPTDIRDYKSHLLTVARRKPATINRHLAALRNFFQWAKASKRVQELPTDRVSGVKQAPRAPGWLPKREVDRIIRAAERDGKKRNSAILMVLRNTGIRVGELCELRLGDIDITERKGTLTVQHGKGMKHRTIPLNVDVRHAIAVYLLVRQHTGDDYLFLGQRGPLKEQAVELIVEKYARLAGLEDVSPHTLRHSFAKQLLNAGEDLPTVAALLGHENINTTAAYLTPSTRDLEQAVAKLEWEVSAG
jgi:site-specific recombinase XerD